MSLAARIGSRWRLRDDPRPEYPGSASVWTEHRRVVVASFLLFGVLLALRTWANLVHPSLFVEDTTHYFNVYYGGDRGFGTVFQQPHGYYNLLNNLVAWAASWADVRLQPAIYQGVAVVLAVTASCTLAFSGLYRSRWTLLVLPAVLGLSGMNHVAYYTTLTFQMYVVVVLLLCLTFLQAPRRGVALAGTAALLGLLIWSGPYSVVAVPAAALSMLLFRGRRRNALLGWVVVCTLVYAQTARGLVRFENLTDPQAVRTMVEVFVGEVLLLDLAGAFAWWKAALGVAALGAVLFRLRGEGPYLRVSALFLVIVGGALAPLFLSTKFADYPDPYPCHTFISQFFWLAFLLYTADRFLRRSSRERVAGWAVVAVFGLLVAADNARHPEKGYMAVREGLPEFLERVRRVEELGLEERNRYVVVELPGYDRHFVPRARVGSRREDAKRLPYEEVEPELPVSPD